MMLPNLYYDGGTLPPDRLYVDRQADAELLSLCKEGEYVYILTPRQMGKSSLMVRTQNRLQDLGIISCTVDLTDIGANEVTPEQWYYSFLNIIYSKLQLDVDLDDWWHKNSSLTHPNRFINFFKDIVLIKINHNVIVFVDEIDSTLRIDFRDDFFAAIRSLYNARASEAACKRLSIVLIGAATPSDLISDQSRTPFNIGKRVELSDFTFAEAKSLTLGFNLPNPQRDNILRWIMNWTNGHPYLTHRLCKLVAEDKKQKWNEIDIDNLVAVSFFGEQSSKDSNLHRIREMLTNPKQNLDIYKILDIFERIRSGINVFDEEQSIIKAHLKLSGVVKREINGQLVVRNAIYKEVFDRDWIENQKPTAIQNIVGPKNVVVSRNIIQRSSIALFAAILAIIISFITLIPIIDSVLCQSVGFCFAPMTIAVTDTPKTTIAVTDTPKTTIAVTDTPKATIAVTDTPKNSLKEEFQIAFLVDQSGSMKRNDPDNYRFKALQKILNYLANYRAWYEELHGNGPSLDIQSAIVYVGADVQVISGSQNCDRRAWVNLDNDPTVATAFTDLVNQITPELCAANGFDCDQEGTNYLNSVQCANAFFSPPPQNVNQHRVVIFITDGGPSCGAMDCGDNPYDPAVAEPMRDHLQQVFNFVNDGNSELKSSLTELYMLGLNQTYWENLRVKWNNIVRDVDDSTLSYGDGHARYLKNPDHQLYPSLLGIMTDLINQSVIAQSQIENYPINSPSPVKIEVNPLQSQLQIVTGYDITYQDEGDNGLFITQPDGTQLKESSPGVKRQATNSLEIWTITNPPPGEWTITKNLNSTSDEVFNVYANDTVYITRQTAEFTGSLLLSPTGNYHQYQPVSLVASLAPDYPFETYQIQRTVEMKACPFGENCQTLALKPQQGAYTNIWYPTVSGNFDISFELTATAADGRSIKVNSPTTSIVVRPVKIVTSCFPPPSASTPLNLGQSVTLQVELSDADPNITFPREFNAIRWSGAWGSDPAHPQAIELQQQRGMVNKAIYSTTQYVGNKSGYFLQTFPELIGDPTIETDNYPFGIIADCRYVVNTTAVNAFPSQIVSEKQRFVMLQVQDTNDAQWIVDHRERIVINWMMIDGKNTTIAEDSSIPAYRSSGENSDLSNILINFSPETVLTPGTTYKLLYTVQYIDSVTDPINPSLNRNFNEKLGEGLIDVTVADQS